MSAALATSPTPTPDATNLPADHVPALLPGIGRVVAVVRCLIGYGRQLADGLRRHGPRLAVEDTDAGADFHARARRFGTADIAIMLLRIARGIRRAAALEALLLARAARGRDLVVASIRLPSLPRDPSLGPSAPRPIRAPLPLEPSDEEIAADVRRRPVGAVIMDICHDLGVLPGELGEMQRELTDAVIYYGGSLVRLVQADEVWRLWRERNAPLRAGATGPPA